MAEIEPTDATRPFRELHGDYVENAGQQISLREYLDYFEPLGSALARLPDGTGGPFVHHFTDSGGRAIGSLGWVVSAKSKRFGGWKLWGMWSDRPMPAVALPLFWSVLPDPKRVSDWIARANDDADLLLDAKRWGELLKDVKATRLREGAFREYLKAELSRAWAVPPPHRHPIEVELTPRMLDLLPWLYLLGPVDPASARLQPNRFNGAGYQYILSDDLPDVGDAEITPAIDRLVDAAAASVSDGWRMANDIRARRNQPPRAARESRPARPARPREREKNEMRTDPPPPSRKPQPAWKEAASVADAVWKPVYQIAVLALLGWIAWNVHLIRKERPVPTTTEPARSAATETVAPTYEPDLSRTRIRRIATAVGARPSLRVSDAVVTEISRGGTDAADKLARVAVEVFLRRNGCYDRTQSVDGKFSTAEQRAIRNCALLQDERLINGTEPDTARAVQWLEDTVTASD